MRKHLPFLAAALAILALACSKAPVKPPEVKTCPAGQVLVQNVCVVPGANCTPGAISSIVTDCATKNRVCYQDRMGALCGVCIDGYVSGGDACHKRKGCTDAGCDGLGRTCLTNGNADATCGTCVPGRLEKDGACVPVTCDPSDALGPAASCRAQFRVCVAAAGTAPSCGGCWPGYVDDGGTCRPAKTCGVVGCKDAMRLCTAAGTSSDAACGDCRAGYQDESGLCVRRTGTTCDAAAGDASILAGCTAENRGCAVAGDGSADCTACTTGFAEDPDSGLCVENKPCSTLGCDAEHRNCEQDPFGHCAACADGFVEDPGATACRAAVTCSQLTCPEGTTCVEGGTGQDASCVPSCGPGTIRKGDTCAHCPACTATGEDGIDGDLTQAGYCICKTQVGYFYSVSGDVGTFACDGDNDGWVRESARTALDSTDPVIVRNARCRVRQIDAFTLVAEGGSEKRIALNKPLAMFETDRNDDDSLLAAIEVATGITPYGRDIHAAEINRLTKMCHTRRADYNDNGVADVEEWGGQDLAPTMRPEQRPFNDYSYFAELYTGAFAPSAADPTHGDYVITERPRDPAAADAVPIHYADTDGAYGLSCTVRRDAEWNTLSPPIGMDFAGKQDTGDTWPGMNHHSQYKCVVMDDQPRPQVPSEMKPSDALDYLGRSVSLRLNSCEASGDPATQEINPSLTSFSCSVVPDNFVQAGDVFWAAVPFLDYDPYHKHPGVTETSYLRGCINECADRLTSCFGYDLNPKAVNCSYDVANFGQFLTCQAQELCDGLDNDGNGLYDEGDPGSGFGCANDGSPLPQALGDAGNVLALPRTCTGNAKNECGGGFLCDKNLLVCVTEGVCIPGHTDCQNGKIVCVSDVTPGSRTEMCNVDGSGVPIDDNCDGRANESDPQDGQSCTVTGLSGVCAAGKRQCTAATGSEDCVQTVFPGTEICNGGIDDDCNGKADSGDAPSVQNCNYGGFHVYYKDADGDGYGLANDAICACSPDYGNHYTATTTGDCCDSDSSAHPGQGGWYTAVDACGSWDYNCNNSIDQEYTNTSDAGCIQGTGGNIGRCYDGPSGWTSGVASCGQTAAWYKGSCSDYALPCGDGDEKEQRTQACH